MLPRSLALIVAVVVLAGCAGPQSPSAAPDELELEGRVVSTAAAGSDGGWMLDVRGEGYLPLAITGAPPIVSSGVVIEVPVDLDLPSDDPGIYEALAAYSADEGVAFVVLDFLP